MKTVILDIETTDLAANMGFVLCVSYKPYGFGRVRSVVIDPKRLQKACKLPGVRGVRSPDYFVVKEALERLKDFDILVTFNGKRFDIPFLRARALYHDNEAHLAYLPRWHIDLSTVLRGQSARIVPKKFVSLQQVQGFLGIPAEEGKTPLSYETWSLAHFGSKRALREVVEHCERDVLVLERAYERAKELVKVISRT